MNLSTIDVTSGNYKNEKIYSWGPGIRNKFIIHYVIKGKGYFKTDKKTYTVKEGQSFIIYPHKTISYWPDKKNPWKYAWVNFDSKEPIPLIKNINFLYDNCIIDKISKDKILPYYEKLSELSFDSSSYYSRFSLGLLILSIYYETYPNKYILNSENFFKESLSYIDNNFHLNDCTPKNIAKELGISYSSLYRLFISKVEMSPMEYLQKYRIDYASKLLSSGESVQTTAFSCGYCDQFYFSKVFKKEIGVSPLEYKKIYNKLNKK